MALRERDGLPWGTSSLWEALRENRLSPAEGPDEAVHFLLPMLHVDTQQPGDGQAAGWVAYAWQPPQVQSRPPRGAGVATFARRLIAQERRRVRRSTFPGHMDRRDRRSAGAA